MSWFVDTLENECKYYKFHSRISHAHNIYKFHTKTNVYTLKRKQNSRLKAIEAGPLGTAGPSWNRPAPSAITDVSNLLSPRSSCMSQPTKLQLLEI